MTKPLDPAPVDLSLDAVVLAYQHFTNAAPVDTLSVRIATFERQLDTLRTLGYRIVPLRALVERLYDPVAPLPRKAASITIDDGHGSIHRLLKPALIRARIPATLFVYPPAISGAGATLTWRQLRSLHETGWADVQVHAWWHPDFGHIHAGALHPAWQVPVLERFRQARQHIEQALGAPADMLAWPFGLHSAELGELARQAGYIAAFTLAAGKFGPATPPFAIPRLPMTEAHTSAVLRNLLLDAAPDS